MGAHKLGDLTAKIDLNGKLECIVSGLGQDEFNTLVELAEKANEIMEASRRKQA